MKNMTISFVGNAPMTMVAGVESDRIVDPQHKAALIALESTLRAYLKSSEALASGKYLHLGDAVPKYLSSPGMILVMLCLDGVVIRYETKTDEPRKLGVGYSGESIAETVEKLSQKLIRIRPVGATQPAPEDFGIEVRLSVGTSPQQISHDIFASRIGFDVVNSPVEVPQAAPAKPHCLLSVRNSFEFEIRGEMLPSVVGGKVRPFIATTPVQVGVGWECIEVFPNFEINAWRPEYAPLWAETDILSAALVAQSKEMTLQSLDPKAATRQQFAVLLKEFRNLLDSNPEREQILHAFLQKNPALLCPQHLKTWSKLPLGAHITDFVFQDANHEYLLVELERSNLSLFRQDGHPTAEFTHAHGQIVDWKRYLEDNLQTVQRELGLVGITPNPMGLLVMGRSSMLTEANKRKLQTMMNESPKFRVLTYDDLFQNAKAVLENLLGPMSDEGGATRIIYPDL